MVKSVCAHPAYRDGSKKYRRIFDIYSLGAALLEIGTWRRAAGSIRPRRAVKDMQGLLIESCQKKLGPAMGRIYLNAFGLLTSDFAANGPNSIDEREPN
jgi:hypothetical protein